MAGAISHPDQSINLISWMEYPTAFSWFDQQ
jgi:hypothetical protein